MNIARKKIFARKKISPKKTRKKLTRRINISSRAGELEKMTPFIWGAGFGQVSTSLLLKKPSFALIGITLMGASAPAKLFSKQIKEKMGTKNLEKIIGKPRLSYSISKKVKNPWQKTALNIIGEAKTREEKETAKKFLQENINTIKDVRNLRVMALRAFKRNRDPLISNKLNFFKGMQPFKEETINKIVNEVKKEINRKIVNEKEYFLILEEKSFDTAISKHLDIIGIRKTELRKQIRASLNKIKLRREQKKLIGQKLSFDDILMQEESKKIRENLLKSGKPTSIREFNHSLTGILDLVMHMVDDQRTKREVLHFIENIIANKMFQKK